MKKNAPQQQEEPTAYFESAGEPTPLLWLPHSRKRAAKKAIVKEKPWRFAFWLDSGFQFTAKEAFALCRTLPESLRTIETVQTLEELIREAFSEQSHKKGKPSPAQITAQLQELETRLSLLLETLTGLHSPTLSLMECTTPIQSLRQEIRALKDRLRYLRNRARWVAYQHRTPQGAPKQQARRNFIDTLCQLWTHGTGKQPTCSNNPNGGYSGPFYHFAYAAIAPAFGETGLSEAIADVVKARCTKGKKSAKK